MTHETQQVASALLEYLDKDLWQSIALKVIDKIPRTINSQETTNNLQDFVLMNSNVKEKQEQKMPLDRQISGKMYQKMLSGCSSTVKRQRRAVTEPPEQPPSSLALKRLKKMSSRVMTEGIESKHLLDSQLNSINSSIQPLFISQPKNSELISMQDFFRTSKNQQHKFNQRQQQQSSERLVASQQRLAIQRRKYKQAKMVTYDYQGKIVPVAPKKSDNVKVFNIKSFFKSNMAQQKQNLSKKMSLKYDPAKVVTVNAKKVISMEHRREEDRNDASLERLGKTTPVSLIQMFRGHEEVQMGVSFTDATNQSTIYGATRKTRPNKSMKLSEFKQKNASHFKPRSKTTEKGQPGCLRQIKVGEPGLIDKKFSQKSDAESIHFSSSFTNLKKNMGKIIKNEYLYTENFEDRFQ